MSVALSEPLMTEDFEPFQRLSRDLKFAARKLDAADARWLVDEYYTIQDARMRSAAQQRHSEDESEPNALISWIAGQMRCYESDLKRALGEFAASYRVGLWMQSIYGIGPVLSAAMLCNLDIRKAPTVGHWWRFAGLDPTSKWEKGQKRPWNAKLKAILTYRMGECFVKFQNRNECQYGKLFAERKAMLAEQNARGEFKATADAELEAKGKRMLHTQRIQHWREGRLAPAHIHDRARRWVVKLFLSHIHRVMHLDFHGTEPPKPYVLTLPNHVHEVVCETPFDCNGDGRPLSELYCV